MSKFFDGIIRASGEQWLGFILTALIAGVCLMFIKMMASDHEIRCYYAKSTSTDAGFSYKLMGDVDWSEDVTVFIAQGPKELIDFSKELRMCATK